MAKRSLQASAEGIIKAKQAFKYKGWTQEYLASEVGLETRQPIWKFFSGKSVDRQVFHEICFILNLDPEDIVEKAETDQTALLATAQENTLNVDALVSKLRAVRDEKIQDQCGTLHLVDIARPCKLDDLYVDVNILEEITSQRWLEIKDFQGCESNASCYNTTAVPSSRHPMKAVASVEKHLFSTASPSDCLGNPPKFGSAASFDLTSVRNALPEELDRCGLGKVCLEQVTGLEAVFKYSKLMVMGKPGSGKTTFLQSIALRCNRKELKPDCLPIFISLKHFAEDTSDPKQSQISLFNYLNQEFISCGASEQELPTILFHGKAVILLDGLDEVVDKNSDKVIKEIREFAERFYKNQIIITCRIAAQTYKFKGFTEVEIADFNKTQIAAFTEKWFLVVAKNSVKEAKAKTLEFIQKLKLAENQQIQELVNTPILLNLTCLVFQFLGDFPSLRSELYKQGLDLLLVRWDEVRGIKRDDVNGLSLLHKIKLLSRVAENTFTQGDYFFPETKLVQLIADYLSHLPHVPTDADALQVASRAVLKSLETQHGLLVERAHEIYSFSHLTFQEYFTAKEIVANANSQTLREFVTHIKEKRWLSVFLLTAEMLHPADDLLQLMKQQIDTLAASSKKIQDFLNWIGQKSSTVTASYHPAGVRAFYFTLALPVDHPLSRNQNLALSLDRRLALKLTVDLALDLALTYALAISVTITADIFYQRLSAIGLALDLEHLLAEHSSLRKPLQYLKNQLPFPRQGKQALKAWWQANGETWTGELRSLMIGDRQIGHNWQFNETECQLLQQYWDANKLLLDCLNSASDVTPKVRQLIEETLLVVSS